VFGLLAYARIQVRCLQTLSLLGGSIMTRRPNKPRLTIGQRKAAFQAELDATYSNEIHKELWYRSDIKPEETLYRWWWEFMRASEEIEGNKARELVGKSADDTLKAFGEIGDSFEDWWDRVGVRAFIERRVPLIKPFIFPKYDQDDSEMLRIDVSIPLTISKDLIIAQIKILLDHFHENEDFKRQKYSTADLKIHAKHRYRKDDYNLILEIWKLNQSDIINHIDRPLWKIYCIASSKGNIPTEKQLETVPVDKRIEYGKRCSELLAIAEEMMKNALTGSFPNYTEARAKKAAAKSEREKNKKNAVAPDE